MILLFGAALFFLSGLLAQNITSASNQIDARGQKQGYWKKTATNGEPIYEGNFKDNLPIGEFRYFYPNGKIKAKMIYEDDGITATTKFFHPNQKIQAEGRHVNQKKEGLWIYFNDAGIKLSEENFLNDEYHGLCKNYYADGQVLETTTYEHGKKNGKWQQFYSDGAVKSSGNYLNGQLHGPATFYYPDGKISIAGQYERGFKNGVWTYFDKQGKPERTENWQMGTLPEGQVQAEPE